MKKIWISVLIFIAVFAGVYLLLCYLPGMRIKLAADAGTYFLKSLQHNMGFKASISGALGLLAGCLPLAISRKKD